MKKVIALILVTAFLFSTMEVALKIGGGDFEPLQLTFLRFMIGGLVLLPFGIKECKDRGVALDYRDYLWFLLLGTMCIPVSMLCFQLGVNGCNAATAAGIICFNPVFTMIFASIFAGETLNKFKVGSILLALLSMFFLLRLWDVQEGNSAKGIICMLIAAITFGLYTVLGKRTLKKYGTFAQTSVSFIFGSMVMLPLIAALGRPVFAGVSEHPAMVLYTGIMITGLGYLFYFLAIKYSDAATGSIAFFIKPAIAPVLAMIFLKETILWNTVVGIVILIAASLLILYVEKHKELENSTF